MFWKILSMLFGKKKKKRPISATEIIKRGPRSSEYIEWSRNKRIRVFNPPFWGIHDIFVDADLPHAVFRLKEDNSSFVFIGNSNCALNFTHFDPFQNKVETRILEEGQLLWQIYNDFVIYRGDLLPPTTEPYYWGKVIGTSPFNETINEKWILQNLKELLAKSGS